MQNITSVLSWTDIFFFFVVIDCFIKCHPAQFVEMNVEFEKRVAFSFLKTFGCSLVVQTPQRMGSTKLIFSSFVLSSKKRPCPTFDF